MRSPGEEWPLHLGAAIIFLIIIATAQSQLFCLYPVATSQDIDQMIYFKAFIQFFYFNRYCD